jgi:uncharacterized membrane protein YphA (DoxX/SURF4 family)
MRWYGYVARLSDRGWIGIVSRVVVGVIWIWAAWAKLSDPDPRASVYAVRAYRLLPEAIVPFVGHALPIVEILVGALLILGVFIRPMAVVSSLMFVAFIIGIASVWARGLSIDCGCFGGGGYEANAASKYPWEIARDAGLLLLSLYLVWRPRSPLSVDNLLARLHQKEL